MLKNAYFLAKIGADTAENEQHFAEILPIGRRVAERAFAAEKGRDPLMRDRKGGKKSSEEKRGPEGAEHDPRAEAREQLDVAEEEEERRAEGGNGLCWHIATFCKSNNVDNF